MSQAVLLGDPEHFHIRSGANPHTRDVWGRRKKVDPAQARLQWERFKTILQQLGLTVHVVKPDPSVPGLVFPANAGFRFGQTIYLSNLHPGRSAEQDHYHEILSHLGLEVKRLEVPYRFEGEADFIPVGDPSGEPEKTVYLFTYGRLQRPRWVPRVGWPPYKRIYGFRSDHRVLKSLQSIIGGRELLELELINEAHYHGDTVLCPFGAREQFLLVYLEGFSVHAQAILRDRFGDRLIPLAQADAARFAANSFQVKAHVRGRQTQVLLMPDGLSQGLTHAVRDKGVLPFPVDVSEFLSKGGGAIKCMLLNLGELTG